jgi:hypothetical protein
MLFGGIVFLVLRIKMIGYAIALLSSHIFMTAQQIDPRILELRAESVANICSMIAGTDQSISSPLKGIPSPIKKADDPNVFYNHVLQQKKDGILSEFQIHGITNVEIKKMQKDYGLTKPCSPIKKENRGLSKNRISSALQRKSRNVFREFTDQSIPLVKRKYDDTPAAADDSTVFVDENCMKNYKSDAQSFIFAHEINHLLEKHSSEEFVIKKTLKENYGQLTEPLKADLNLLSRCNETIADVKAVVVGGLDFAKGYENFAKQHLKAISDKESSVAIDASQSTHPAFEHRHNQALLLKEELALLAKKS